MTTKKRRRFSQEQKMAIHDAAVACVCYWAERATFQIKQSLMWLGIPGARSALGVTDGSA